VAIPDPRQERQPDDRTRRLEDRELVSRPGHLPASTGEREDQAVAPPDQGALAGSSGERDRRQIVEKWRLQPPPGFSSVPDALQQEPLLPNRESVALSVDRDRAERER